MPRRKKHSRLPNGYGSIRYLGKNRKNPYAVHPPANIDGDRPAALCYVDDWMKGFIILTAYKAGTYKPGMEKDLEVLSEDEKDLDTLAQKLMADYSLIKGVVPPEKPKTFAGVYQLFYDSKYHAGSTFSQSSKDSMRAAYKNSAVLHDRPWNSLRAIDFQTVLDSCPLKRSSIELILNLFRQMCDFAVDMDISDKNYSRNLTINKDEDDEHGIPFTPRDLMTLWCHSDNDVVELLLILCYSGWRINEVRKLHIDLENGYFEGGIKTKAGKNRIVPIHSAIYSLVQHRYKLYGTLLSQSAPAFRQNMYQVLAQLGIEKHTPHDCRHTFSKLCEDSHVNENDRKRMLGHSFSTDVTNRVYGHRDLKDLKIEIEKIDKECFVTLL